MKLIFHPTNDLKEYDATDVQPKACYDGQVIDVPAHRVQRLMEVYPRNFEEPGPPQTPSKKRVVSRTAPLKSIVPPTSSSKEYHPPLHKELSLSDSYRGQSLSRSIQKPFSTLYSSRGRVYASGKHK